MEETDGAIGFDVQKDLLDAVRGWLPIGTRATLHGDRFYGTLDLIRWCQDSGWDYRLRLKGNLLTWTGSRKATTGNLALSGAHYFQDVALTGKCVGTNIGIIYDPGHAERKKDRSISLESSPEASSPGSSDDCAKLPGSCSEPCRCQGFGSAC